MNAQPLVSIVIVVMDYQLRYFEKLAQSIYDQTYPNIELVLVDKTETTSTRHLTRPAIDNNPCKIIPFREPAGFARNYNCGIRHSTGDFVFVLNLDTILNTRCIEKLVSAISLDSSVGCVSPKILRMDENQELYKPAVLDSAGMYLLRMMRHLDRGGGEVDCGQYDRLEYVFGVTGAGAFFRRSCLDEVAISGQFYDEDFWSYREDADLSWRMQNYGWKCLYTPEAVMHHARTLKPGKRSGNSRLANMHSVKNRYLLMINNMSLGTYFRNAPQIWFRDMIVLTGCFLVEQYSLKGLWYVVRNLRRLFQKRRKIRCRASEDVSGHWFGRRSETFSES